MYNVKKLTKKLLYSLDPGVYIACGCVEVDALGQRESIFHGYVPDVSGRESFWNKIKEAGADQRNCYIFKNKDEYEVFEFKLGGSNCKLQ